MLEQVVPIRKLTLLRKVKEIKELCGGVLEYVEHIILQIDAEISQKGHFRMETRLIRMKSELSTGVKKKRGKVAGLSFEDGKRSKGRSCSLWLRIEQQ